MKAFLMILFVFSIQLSTVFAGPDAETVIPPDPATLFCPECPILSPKVPLEAPFEEMTVFSFPLNLNPEVPFEADFDDAETLVSSDSSFSPEVPAEADFNDSI